MLLKIPGIRKFAGYKFIFTNEKAYNGVGGNP
jgi:hypothetical protein